MSENSAAPRDAAQDDSDRDTLPMPAPVSSRRTREAAVALVAGACSEVSSRVELEAVDTDHSDSRQPEPSVDAKLLSDAFRTAGH